MDGGSHLVCDGHFIHASVNLRWSWMLWALVGFCGVHCAATVQTDTLHVWVHDFNDPPKLQPCGGVATGPWFTVKEDAWEAPICVSLTDDASEMEGTYVDLHVWVSRGMVRCDGVAGAEWRPSLFTTQCAGVSSRPAVIVKESCELHTDGKLRASLHEARSCLENLVYTPPSNFNGEVQMRIAVSDNGFTGSLQASAGEIRTTTELGTIQVDAVNDMPYVTWVTLPPKEMLNNESFPFQGLRIHDPDVVGWKAERTDSFTLTFDTLGGEILFPLGEPLLREQVPAPPHGSKYVRLKGNLSAVQESCARFIYKPPPGFVGEDIVTVRVSDGGLGGAFNLTGELGFRVKVLQALVPVDLVVESLKLTTQEDELLRFGREARTQIKFPSLSSDLFLKIFSTDGALVHPWGEDLSETAATMSVIPGGPNNLRYLNISSTNLEVSGTLAGLNILLDEAHFRHPTRDWFNVPTRPSRISLQACQFDMLLDRTIPGTCATKYIDIDVKPVDDAPSVLSPEHPWALPLETLEDTAMQLCCFTIFDPDVRSAGATASFSSSPWLFRMRIMARFGNISIAESVGNVVLTEQEYNLIGLEGYAADLEPLLNSMVYTPLENMNSNHAVDHLCFFLTDSPGSKRIGNVRDFTGCWDILIQPVNDPPTLTQMFDGTSLEPTCDSLELVNESFDNLTGNLTCASGIRFRLENHCGENAMIPLPPIRIEDIDCEEIASDQPPLSVFVRAELGIIPRPGPCPGLQIRQVGTQLYGFWWEMMGSLSALNSCLASSLMYQPPASTYHGNDAVLVEASDLGHHGLLTESSGTVRLKMLLHVHRVEEPLTLEASPQLLPEAMEDVLVDIRSFTLRYSQLQADVMVRLELTSSCGRLFLSTSLDWRREKAIVMETPVSGEILRWRGRAKDVDVMLQNISYSSDLPGLSCLYGTLSVEQSPETGIYDLVLRHMLQIPIIGVNDAPQVSGPVDWSIQAGTAISLAAMGIRLEDPDAAEGLSDIWRLPRAGLPETAGPEDVLLSGSDILSVIVRVRTSPGLLTVTDWTGVDPTQEVQFQACGVEAAASGQGCSALELRVRPDLLPQVTDRLLLSMPVSQAAAQGDLEVHLDDRGLSGRGEPLSDMWRVRLRVSSTDLPPSFLVQGLQDGPGESMFQADHNRTRPGLEDPVTRAGGLAVQLIPADQNEGRIYECNVSVPFGGEVELAQYNNKFLPEEAIEDVQHRFGAGLQTFLALRASLRNLNVALQVIRFKPFPGFTGSAFLRVTSKLVDSMRANVTEVPIYVEPPVTCNAYMKIADELKINGTDVRKVGEYMLIYAMASGYQESKSAAYINALLVQTVDTLRKRPQEDCDSITVEVVLGPLHTTDGAGGRGYLFLNGSAADNDCVLADTHRAGGVAVFLHGKLSEINATLPHLCYRWLSDAGQEEPFGTEARVSLYIRAYLSADDPRDLISGTMDLVVLPSEAEEPMEMASITMPVSPALQLVATRSSADGAVEVLQGANMTLSTVLQLETDESMHPWPVELDSPTYFELNLSLADGLTFAMPLPVHCTTAELVSRANPNEQVIQQDVSIFSASLAPRTRLNLHASFATMQTCLDQLEVHIPWDTPVTAPQLSTGPYLMSTMPANGSTEVSTSDFQVLLTFNDWVQAGEGYFHIVDCGADNLCGAVGNMDDRVIDISVHDAFSVSFNKHLVLIKHSERLRGLNLHQFVIPPGAIRDISGVDFPGVLAADFTFRTGLASSTPLGWRLTSGNISDEVGQPGGWYVCELQFFLSSDCTTDLMQGTPASSSEANTSTWQEFSEFEANLAFDQSTGTCWWSDSNVPGSWIGLHVKSPGLYARSLKLQGKVGEVKPDEIYVQFYVDGMWYTLQTFGYTEECVSLSSDLSMIFGNEFDTVAPRMVSSVPDLSSSLAVSTTQRISLVFSERIQIVPGSEVRLVDAGDDGLCSTADDTVLSIPVELPTAYAQNGTVPWVYTTGTTVLVRFPDQDMTAGNYHCLQVEPGIIQDLAATPFPGLVGDEFRFLVAATPFQDATEPILVATEPPSGSDLQGLQIHSFKLFMSELVVPVDADLMVRSAQIAGPHEIYLTTLHANGSLDMNTDHIVIPFTPESDVTTPMHLSISDSVLSVTLNKTLLIGKTYTIWIEPNSFTDESTTFIFDITGVPANIPRNFAGLAPGDVVFTVVEPTDLERNPYKKSTIPVWDVEVEEIARPEKEPLMPLHLDHCYVDVPNCTEWNETNGSNTSNCTNFENVSVLSICSLTPRSGMGFAEVREREMWLQPWHWLRATTHNATFQLQLDVRDANSPVLIKSRDEVVHVLAGMPQLLATSENEGPFLLQDDSFGELFVEVSVEPAGTLGILRSAWRDWGGRVNVTFDFPPVQPDYGSLGQGDLTPTTLEGRPASKLSFYGMAVSVEAALSNLSYTAPEEFEGAALMKVLMRDGEYVREEGLVINVQMPPASLQVISQAAASVAATASTQHDLNSLGCGWSVEDGAGAMLPEVVYHLTAFVVDPLACAAILFEDCASRPVQGGLGGSCASDFSEHSAEQVESWESTDRGYKILHLQTPSFKLLRHHLQSSLIFHPCGCPVNSRFECTQTIYVAVQRRNQQAPEVVEVAESNCLMTVSAPLSMFVALRGSSLVVDEDGVLRLAERFYIEGNSPSPFHFTAFAELGNISAEGTAGMQVNGSKSFLEVRVDSVQDLLQLLDVRQVSYVPVAEFWGEDMIYFRFETTMSPGSMSDVDTPTTHHESSWLVEVRPQPDLPQIDVYSGIEERAMANQPHHVNASIRHVDLGAEDHARVYVESPFGDLSFPALDTVMDEISPGLTEFFANTDFDAPSEAEARPNVQARDGVWPSISMYESSVGDGYTIAGTLASVNRVLSMMQFTPPADSPNSGSLSITVHRTPSPAELEVLDPDMLQMNAALAEKHLDVEIQPLTKSEYPCFIGGPAATFVNPGEDARNLGVTVRPESSASTKVANEVAETLYEFRVSVRFGLIGLDVNKYPAARICPPFYPDVGGCKQDEVDAWVIYGTIEQAALTMESIVYTPPVGYAGQDLMRVTGSCSEVTLEVALNIVKGFSPPRIRCCDGVVLEVQRALEPSAVPPCYMERNEYGEIPAVAQVMLSTDIGQLAFWPVAGLYFDHSLDVMPMHNVSSQIVASGPGGTLQLGLATKLALLFVPETEMRTAGRLTVEVLDARSGLKSTSTCPIHVSTERKESLPQLQLDMPTPNATYLLSGRLGARRQDALLGLEVDVPPVGLIAAVPHAACLVLLHVAIGELDPPLLPPRRLAVQWSRSGSGREASYRLLAESAEDAAAVLGRMRYMISEAELEHLPMVVPIDIAVYALPTAQLKDADAGILRDQRVLQLEIDCEPSVPILRVRSKELEVQRGNRLSFQTLGAELHYPRRMVLQLLCNSCFFFNNELQWHGVHQVAGSAPFLQKYMEGLQLEVKCSSCDADQIILKAWDPDALGRVGEETKTAEGNLIVQASTQVLVQTSRLAQGEPLLRVLSAGVLAKAGEATELVDYISLQSADPNEPLGLAAVQSDVEVRLSALHGILEIDVANLVSGSAFLADAKGGAASATAEDEDVWASTGARMNITAFSNPAPDDQSRLPYVDPSRPTDPWNLNLSETEGPIRPDRVLWSGRSLLLRGAAQQMKQTLKQLKYTPDESAAGWDTVLIRMGRQTGEIPVYSLRQVGDVVLKATPLKTLTVGEVLRLNVTAELNHLVQDDDVFSALVTCGHGGFALWSFAGRMEVLGSSLEFSGNTTELQDFLANVTYVHADGFTGLDRLQIFVQGRPIQAANREAPAAELSIAVMVQLTETILPPASVEMPERLNVFEDSVTPPRIKVHDLRPVAPSGVALASATTATDLDRTCLRAAEPDTWITQTLSSVPCDLFLVVGSNGTSVDQLACDGCTLRAAHLPDECLTWVTGPVAEVAGLSGGWALAACQNNTVPEFASQSFQFSTMDEAGGGRFCVEALNSLEGCFDILTMTVNSQTYRGLPTVTTLVEGVEPPDCSGSWEVMNLSLSDIFGENISEDLENLSLPFAKDRCEGDLSCEFLFQPVEQLDPAPGCNKEVIVSYTCPNHLTYESRARLTPNQTTPASVMIQCPVVFLPSPDPVALRGSLQVGSFSLKGVSTMWRLRQLTACPEQHEPSRSPLRLLSNMSLPSPGAASIELLPEVALFFSEDVFVGRGKALLREVEKLARGANDDPDQLREFTLHLTAIANRASYQVTTPLLPLTVYEVVLEPGAVEDADGWAFEGFQDKTYTFTTGFFPVPVVAPLATSLTEEPLDTMTVSSRRKGMSSFAKLVDGERVSQFCVMGAPVALAEFAEALRYSSALHWSGNEPMRITIAAAYDSRVVHSAAESWILVQPTNDLPLITANEASFQVQVGRSVAITGINISDPDAGDQTRWMTLLVAASTGRLYLEPSFKVEPNGTLEPLKGRLDGDFALRVQGSGPDLQAFVDALRFGTEAPAKPYLEPLPLDQPRTEAIVSYILSDTIGPQAGALRRHQVAGKVVNPETSAPIEDVDVVLIARDKWHDYEGYDSLPGCDVEITGLSVEECKTRAVSNSYIAFSFGLYQAGGSQACCFKTADAETILTNLVADANVNVYVFQPGGYSVHTKTTELGIYAAIMPTAPADIYFAKTLHATRSLSVDVQDNIQVGGLADIYLQALAVVTIWRFEVDWKSSTPVDLDAHAFDAWDCHAYFANRQCQHDGSHGLTVTLNRDNRDVLHGREVITVHQWPCDSDQATIGGYRDVWSCLAHFWVQIFSDHGFSDVEGTVSIFRGGVLVQEVQLPAAKQPDSFWIGFVLDWSTSTVDSFYNQAGGAEVVENFIGGIYELPPARDVRRLRLKENVTSAAKARHGAWREQLRQDLLAEKESEAGSTTKPPLHYRLEERRLASEADEGNVAEVEDEAESPSRRVAVIGDCGDGIITSDEECDDGNSNDTDGCSNCTVDDGFYCREEPSECSVHNCSDGFITSDEECDDENVDDFDGCTSECKVETGYYCSGEPSVCATRCGDGRRIIPHEQCDDENALSGDGCSATCQIEAGYVCKGGTEMIRDHCYPKCGDGVRVPHESCDDGNTQDGDGCSSRCRIELGYACHGGNTTHVDNCRLTVCGDGVVEGAEECDDFNDYGGDGCSAVCLWEIKEVASWSQTDVMVTIRPLGQLCRIYNARKHRTFEDTTYHLQNTILTGDVSEPDSVRIHVEVVDGSIAIRPLVELYLEKGRNDSVWEAIVQRETGVRFYPYSDNMKDTIISGTYFEVDRFLRHYLYIAPDPDFSGYVQVLFAVTSGMVLNHGAEECKYSTVIQVVAVYDDPASVLVPEEVQTNGFHCLAGSASCSLGGISLYDPDCEMAVDGSCYLRLELNVTDGQLSIPGHPDGWQEVFPGMMGHAAGLNAALDRLVFFPPSLPPEQDAIFHVTVNRVIERTIATPPSLLPASTSLALAIKIQPADTPPTVGLASGQPFHGALFVVEGSKPFQFTNIVFEPPGASSTTCVVELRVSRGILFLGDTEGLWFADGTNNGESRLRFVGDSSDIRNRFLADVRYAWDDNDCSNLEQFNISVDSGEHQALTLIAMLVLPSCQGYEVEWRGGALTLEEDSEISIGHLAVSTKDLDLFLVVDVKHPPDVAGDCKVVRWPEAVPSFMPGRECHLDGLIGDLSDTLQHLVYKPPPDFVGHVQLQFVIYRAEVKDEILGVESSRGMPMTISVDIEVSGVNDAPALELDLDSYAFEEDTEDYVSLGPLFVSDSDAGENLLSFKFELVSGHDWNRLMMCGLVGVDIEEPWENTLDEAGCLDAGTSLIHFNTTVENFNSMQTGPGRLQFKPAPDWHGSAMINITVDDRGSGHGEQHRRTVHRSLYIVVEPMIDKPKLSILCPEALPFLGYGRTCLEVRECFALNASLDTHDAGLSFWMVIEASDPGVGISLEDRAPVQVWREGTSSVQVSGLYHNVQQALRALIFRPPVHLFAAPDDPDVFEFNVSIQAFAIGERFNEPLPLDPGLIHARPGLYRGKPYPSDSIDFPVVIRRVNRAPLIFMDVDHYSVTQMQDDVNLYGVSVIDPDARAQDEFEVVISVESDSGGGAVSFAGTQGTYVQKRMTLAELNVELQDLFFIFRDVNWYGTTGVSISVSDLGNRGWKVNSYSDMYHEDISPQSVALKGGTMTIVPEDSLWHHSLFSQDFTWELYGKVMPSVDNIHPTTFGTTPPPPTFQPYDLESAFDGLLLRNDYLGENISSGVDDPFWGSENASHRPLCSFSIGSDGRLKFTLLSEEGRLQGTGRAFLEEGTWYHLALVVRRRSRDVDIPPAESEADTTLGEVALYVDKKLDAAYRWRAPQRFVGPTRRSALQVSVGKSGGLVLSRARLWPRALEAGDLAQCDEPLGSVAGGPEGLGDARPRETHHPFPHLVGVQALDAPALSFSFGGSLAEASRRARVLSTGSWSFVADSPPPCLGLTQTPYDSFFEYCVAYDHAFSGKMEDGDSGETQYFWQSPQAYQSLDAQLYAAAGVKSVETGELTAGTFLSVHRSFVNEPPRIVMLEPRSGLLHVFEDHANFMSFMVKHKAAENLLDRDLTVFLSTTHGRVRTISSAAISKSSLDGKRVEYTAKLHELNAFLSQLQYLPDPNYNGPDLMDMLVTDGEYSVNTSVQVEIETMSDPITIVCPPAVDLFEGQVEVPIGTNISIRDHEPIPGFDDESSRVGVEIFVGDGGLDLLLEAVPHLASDLREALDEVRNDTYDAHAADDSNRSSPGVPAFVFNTTLAGFRAALRALVFTPFPELYHGVVHLEVRIVALETEEETRCEIGLIVHPVNSAPEIAVDESRLLSATNGGLVKPHKDIHLNGVIRLSDPDEENFSGGWFVQRVHSARLKLRASCGFLSFLMAGPQDYVLGVQNGSIAGTEGITFHSGDGAHDTDMDVTSTLRNLNLQLSRLFYHSGGDCRGENITIAVELDDLGNYGAYMDEMGNYGHPRPIVVTNEVYFQVLEF